MEGLMMNVKLQLEALRYRRKGEMDAINTTGKIALLIMFLALIYAVVSGWVGETQNEFLGLIESFPG